MRRLFLLTTLIYVCMTTIPVIGSEISNFFTPYGFKTPLLKQGQYALNFNPQYYRHESQMDTSSIDLIHSETIQKQYSFSLNGIYALTDALTFESSLFLYPGQTISTNRYVWNYPYDYQYVPQWEFKFKEHSYFTMGPVLQLSFHPQANIQLYGDFCFSKHKSFYESEDEKRFRDLKSEEIYFNLGFTTLGGLSAGKTTKPKDFQLFNFLQPYGFRAPVLSRGQYALNFNSFYVRSESSWDQFSGAEWERGIWKRYYFSLNGLYAVTKRILFRGPWTSIPPRPK